MPRWLRIVLVVLAVVILLPAAAVAVLVATFDPNAYKPRVIEAVRRATGRELTLSGPLHLSLALTPTLQAENVALANVAGGSRPQMATVESLRVRMALLPLLHRQLVIDSVDLQKPDILLEINAAGQPNWRFGPPAAPATPHAAAAPSPDGGPPGERLAIDVRSVTLTDGRITYRDARSGQSRTLDLPSLDMTEDGPQSPILLRGQATLDSLTARFNVRASPLAQLAEAPLPEHVDLDGTLSGQPIALSADLSGGLDGTAPASVNIAAKSGDATLTMLGSIARPALLSGLDMAVSARIPDPARVAALAGQTLPPLGALAFDGRATGDARGEIALHGFKLTLAAGDLGGDVILASGPVPSIRGTLSSNRLDIDALRAATGQPRAAPLAAPPPAGAPPAPPAVEVKAPAGGRVIPDTPLPLSGLSVVNADVQASVAALIDGGVTIGKLDFHLMLSGGKLVLDPLTAQLPAGAMQAAVTIDASQPPPAPAAVALRLHAPGLAMQTLLAGFRLPELARGPVDVLADVNGSGRTPRAIAASLDGTVGLAMENGALQQAGLQKAFGDAIRSARLPAELVNAAGETAIHCFAMRLDFARGHGTLRTLLLDASTLHLEGDGSIDLADEALALNLRPLARLGGEGVAVPVRVTGTFAAPRGALDTGAVAGAIAGGGGFRAVIGALSGAASGAACGPSLAIARGGAVPSPGAIGTPAPSGKPPNPAELLKRLFR